MDLRDSVWSILSDVSNEAERVLLDPGVPSHDIAKVNRFINQLQNVSRRVIESNGRVRAPGLARSVTSLMAQCEGALAGLKPSLDRALLRIDRLSRVRRKEPDPIL